MCIAGGEICFATMDGSGAHEESIMARNLRSETEEILNENIDKSYGFTCIIGYLVFYDFDVFRMPDGFRYSYSINTDYCAEIVRVAESQVGYKEKASNSDLDSFTANAGSAN